MLPVDFEGTNMVFSAPEGADHVDAQPLPACVHNRDGQPYILTAWKPSFEDLAALNRGEPLYLSINSSVLYPIGMFTMDENGKANT